MSFKLKKGVDVLGLSPAMALGCLVVAGVYEELNLDCVITSCCDGKHGHHSHHYKGMAIDFRTRHVPEWQLPKLVRLLKESLEEQFQVVLEKDHIHIEYDPA